MGRQGSKWILFLFLMIPLVCGMGCSTSDLTSLLGGTSTGSKPPVDLSPSSPGTTGSSTTPSTGTSTSSGSTGSGSTSLPDPSPTTAPPSGPSALTPTDVSSVTAQSAITELSGRGIKVSGSYTDEVLKNTLICARQLKTANTKSMSVNFTGGKGSSGILGVWSNGRIVIYASDEPTAILHEMCHHATLYSSSSQGETVGQNVMNWVQSNMGGSLDSWPASVITGSYARTNEAEFQAEFFSVLRVMDLSLKWDYLAENASSGSFNPPAALRTIAADFYDASGATSTN